MVDCALSPELDRPSGYAGSPAFFAAMRWLASSTSSRTQARLRSIIGPACPSHSMLTTPSANVHEDVEAAADIVHVDAVADGHG